MKRKPRLLVVGDYNRNDFLASFNSLLNDAEFYFIEFASEVEVLNLNYKKFGQAIFWKDFSDAYELIQKVKPDKIVFFFIESFNHVALNASCKVKGIKTYHLEHGFRDNELKKIVLQNSTLQRASIDGSKKISFKARLFTKLFFFNTVIKSPFNTAYLLLKFYSIRYRNSIATTFLKFDSFIRKADSYISFSPKIFSVHKLTDHLDDNYDVEFIGIPTFDHFLSTNNIKIKRSENTALLIDQPFISQGLLGWDSNNKQKFIDEVLLFCKTNNLELNIKLHPLGTVDNELWANSIKNLHFARIVDQEGLLELLPNVSVVFGFYSTLLMPFAALPDIVCVCFENHPALTMNPFVCSHAFVDSGVALQIQQVTELNNFTSRLSDLRELQNISKRSFIESWMYKFDGKSGERLRNILLSINEPTVS